MGVMACCGWSGLRYLCSVLFPCFLWHVLPGLEDLYLFLAFILSEVVLHSLRHVHGLLFVAALLLILWTKRIFSRWQGSQILQADFFKKLCYLMLTLALSLLGVFFVWVPMYEVYARVAAMLDPDLRELAMTWRGTFFVVLASGLFASAVSSTDLFLPPYQVSDTTLSRELQKMLAVAISTNRWLFQHSVLSLAFLLSPCRAVWRGISRLWRPRVSVPAKPINMPLDGTMMDVEPRKGRILLQEVRGQMPTTPGRHTLIMESIVPPGSPARKNRRRSADFCVMDSANMLPARRAPTTRSQPRTFQAEVRGSGSKIRVLRQHASLHSVCRCSSDKARRP